MNITLWVLQAVLAFLYLSGGGYKIFKPETLAGHFRGFPAIGWRALGAIEMVGGVMLVIPAKVTGMPMLTAIVAGVLALETLALALAYGLKSTKMVAANPFAWTATIGILAAIVACGRYAL